jgi:hypothetical protein
MRALIVNSPHGYIDLLTPLPDGAVISNVAKGSYPFVQLFASRRSEIMKSAPILLKRACPNALVWIAYPKKTSGAATDLSRDEVREAVAGFRWRTVSIISIDGTWSALRIRPEREVKPVRPSQPGKKL